MSPPCRRLPVNSLLFSEILITVWHFRCFPSQKNQFCFELLSDNGKPVVRLGRKATGQVEADSRATEERQMKPCGDGVRRGSVLHVQAVFSVLSFFSAKRSPPQIFTHRLRMPL